MRLPRNFQQVPETMMRADNDNDNDNETIAAAGSHPKEMGAGRGITT